MASILDLILNGTAGDAWAMSLPNKKGGGGERWVACRDSDRLQRFCKKRDQPGRATYFCVSTIQTGLARKKENAVELVMLHVDTDFKDHDTPPEQIEAIFLGLPLLPTRLHHTSGGLQAFWLMEVPFVADNMDAAEVLLKRLCNHLGGDPLVCHRVALMRMPGTHNSKRSAEGDQGVLVRVLRERNERYTPEQIAAWLDSEREPVLVRRGGQQPNPFERMGQAQGFKPPVDVQARLAAMRFEGVGGGGIHSTQLSCTASMMHDGIDVEEIVEVILAATKALDGTENWNWREEERAIRKMCRDYDRKFGKEAPRSLSADVVSLRSATKDGPNTNRLPWRGVSKAGEPRNTLHNARVALNALDVACKYDVFQSRIYMGYDGDVSHELQQVVGEISDDAVIALRRICSDEFGANFTNEIVLDAVRSIALDHRYDPVRDELDAAEAGWDGEPRLDRMAVDYLNAADTPLNRSFVRKTMIAAVRRARQPGCKFDTITVLESPEGWNKSGFWRVLAGEDFYSDQSIIGQQAREVQEQLSTVWIHENAELAGMRKTEVEIVKAYASRQTDIARPAYGRVVKRQPRHSIDVGTTNADTYLQSQTGNRRFWPIKVTSPIDLDKLRRDRSQLLGEAAACEASGEEITLDPALWGAAAIEQDARRITDPWEETLSDMPTHAVEDAYGHIECFDLADGQSEESDYIKIIHRTEDHAENRECIATATILRYVLRVPQERQTTATTMRLSAVMRQLGWEKHANKITIGGRQVRGFSRPVPPQ